MLSSTAVAEGFARDLDGGVGSTTLEVSLFSSVAEAGGGGRGEEEDLERDLGSLALGVSLRSCTGGADGGVGDTAGWRGGTEADAIDDVFDTVD